jgi:hypothetical protein
MKTITFRYFDVDYSGLTASSSLVGRLINKLSSAASDRMMPLNKVESDKSDLISDFENVGNERMIAGTYLRIVNSKDVPIITEEMLKQNQFKVSTINPKAKDKEKTCLDYFYFCLTDDKLIVTLDARSSISRFETYINWLLNTKDTGDSINFTPIVDEEQISANDIKKITIDNAFNLTISDQDKENQDFKSKLYSLSGDILNALFSESDSFKELMDANICSANLVIKFSKPKSMDEDEYKRKTAGTVLKHLDNPDGIRFQANGKKIKGSRVLKTEVVDVDCDDNGAVSEQAVYQQMIKKLMKA